MTQHLKSGIPSPKVCQLILADRGIIIDYADSRRLVSGVVQFRKKKIDQGFSIEKVGQPLVNTDLIAGRNKGKVVAQPLKKNQVTEISHEEVRPAVVAQSTVIAQAAAPVVQEKETPVQSQPIIHSRSSARYGRR